MRCMCFFYFSFAPWPQNVRARLWSGLWSVLLRLGAGAVSRSMGGRLNLLAPHDAMAGFSSWMEERWEGRECGHFFKTSHLETLDSSATFKSLYRLSLRLAALSLLSRSYTRATVI